MVDLHGIHLNFLKNGKIWDLVEKILKGLNLRENGFKVLFGNGTISRGTLSS
jgi:hypothetical protein